MPDSPYVLVIAADYDARLERWFADVEAAIPLSRMALRQLAFVATQYCEEHSLAPMDEDGSVFVTGTLVCGCGSRHSAFPHGVAPARLRGDTIL